MPSRATMVPGRAAAACCAQIIHEIIVMTGIVVEQA